MSKKIMLKEIAKKEDGRYLIYYTWETDAKVKELESRVAESTNTLKQ